MPLTGLRILVIEDAQRRFDVVLSDLGLPDIPGDVLIRELRARAGRGTLQSPSSGR